MGVYVLMTKLTPEVSGNLKGREAIGKAWKKMVDERCPDVRWLGHYALLGPYDFMDIYEAASDETAAKVSMITRAGGALTAETWPALAWSRFTDLVQKLT